MGIVSGRSYKLLTVSMIVGYSIFFPYKGMDVTIQGVL